MEYHLKTPFTEDSIRKLKVGDIVYITGTVFTMRDQAHRRAIESVNSGKQLPMNLNNAVIYHCGPVVSKKGDKWEVISSGPTTSMRMEKYEAELIEKFKIRMIIGKGGMGEKTLSALSKFGCVYASFTGGAGVLAAIRIKKVNDCYWLDLGIPEAVWCFDVEEFGPLIVTMDTYKNNLYATVAENVNRT